VEGDGELERMLGALLRIPLRAISARVAADLAAAGYPEPRPAHFAVFQYLPVGGARATELAERAQITKQSMGALVDDLERWGYVERIADPADRRARIVRRTERGWGVEQTARASIRALDAEWTLHIGEARKQQFRAVLEDLARLVDPPNAREARVGGPVPRR